MQRQFSEFSVSMRGRKQSSLAENKFNHNLASRLTRNAQVNGEQHKQSKHKQDEIHGKDLLDEETRGKANVHKVEMIVAARQTLGSKLDDIDRRERLVLDRAMKDRASLLAEVDRKKHDEEERAREAKAEREQNEKAEREAQDRLERNREREMQSQQELAKRHAGRVTAGAMIFVQRQNREATEVSAQKPVSSPSRTRPNFHNMCTKARSIAQLKCMSQEEYVELIYGTDSAEMSVEVQRMRAEQMQKVRRRPSNTTIIHKVLWRAIATTQRSTKERIRRAGLSMTPPGGSLTNDSSTSAGGTRSADTSKSHHKPTHFVNHISRDQTHVSFGIVEVGRGLAIEDSAAAISSLAA